MRILFVSQLFDPENSIKPIRIGREMAARQAQVDQDSVAYGTEPPRRTLTEPPVGYRRPSASAALGPGQRGPVEDKQAVGAREKRHVHPCPRLRMRAQWATVGMFFPQLPQEAT